MESRSLPWDLVEEILSRVPTKSVARFRSTSKQWNALLKSGNFAKKHSANAPKEESLNIMLMDSRVCLVRINYRVIQDNKVATSVKVAAQFDLKDPLSCSSQVDISKVFHCDGLFLCATEDSRLVVWNPCSGETKWIQPRNSYKESDYYALGYVNKKYKILRVDRQYFTNPVRNEYEIYDFTTDSWRVLGVDTDWYLQRSGISVKGNTYWVAFYITETGGNLFLLSFDFSRERFESLPLPDPFPYVVAALSVVREEQLFLLGDGAETRDLHVWVRNSTGSDISWSKFLTVRDSCYSFNFAVSFLADVQNKVVVCCDGYALPEKALQIVGEDKYIGVDIGVDHHGGHSSRRAYCSDLQHYVPSLAQFQHLRSRANT